MVNCPNLCHYASHKVRQEGRDRFSGAVEAFSRRNATGSGLQGEHSRHRDHSRNRSSDDVPSSKDVVSSIGYMLFHFFVLLLFRLSLGLIVSTLVYGWMAVV